MDDQDDSVDWTFDELEASIQSLRLDLPVARKRDFITTWVQPFFFLAAVVLIFTTSDGDRAWPWLVAAAQGDDSRSVEVVRWMVEPGAIVMEKQPIAHVRYDAATIEFPADREGRICGLLVPVGREVPIDTVLCELEPDRPQDRERRTGARRPGHPPHARSAAACAIARRGRGKRA